jgi:small-conductance mechanosensitive channel
MGDFFERWLVDSHVGRFVLVVTGILIVSLLVHFLQRSLRQRIEDAGTRYHARRFIASVGYLLDILIVATVFGKELGGLTVALGVAGAGVAFALQEVIASVAGWAVISFGHFYQTGDRVQLGGTMGDVIDIGVLRTTLMECGQWVSSDLYNGRVVRIANSFVLKEPVFNYSADFPFLWDEVTVPIKYGSSYRLAREILQRAVHEVVGGVLPQARTAWEGMVGKYPIDTACISDATCVEPMVTLVANDNWMEFTARYVVDYRTRRLAKDQIFTRVLEELDRTDGQVAIASTTIHLVQAPELDVRLSGEPAA